MNREDVTRLSRKLRNWGKWGPDDELGALNYVTPEMVVKAARLVKKGKVFSLSIPFDEKGPQIPRPSSKRFNPMHYMIATGTDAVTGMQDKDPVRKGFRHADDVIMMPTQACTHWDALSHIFEGDKMWNGYPATLVTAHGAQKNGIEKFKDKIQGRGVLLDIARWKGVNCLKDGYGITPEDLDACAAWEKTSIGTGDFLLIHTGHLQHKFLSKGTWQGYFGDAPGLTIATAEWLNNKQIAAVAADTMGVEVRPNETKDYFQPWHQIVIPNMGLIHGETFYLHELAEDCNKDKKYEFLFVAPVIPITGGTGSPINPIVIK